jgi:HK97 family phage major capsid protein
MTLAALREKQARIVAEARERLAEIKDDTPAARVAELETQHDTAMAEYDRLEKNAVREEALIAKEAALAAVADESRRPGGGDAVVVPGSQTQTETPEKIDEQRKTAFRHYLTSGAENMPNELRRFLAKGAEQRTFGAQGTGGADFGYGQYLIPQGFMAELVKSLKAWGPMLDPGVTRRLDTATGATIPWPTMNDTSNTGALIAENAQVTLSEIDFGTLSLDAFKYTSGVVLVSSELLQDSALDVEGIVRDAMSERIGRIGNNHLTVGTGSGQPHGIMVAAGAGATAASATSIVFDDLINLFHSVDPLYRASPTCKFMFSDGTLKALRKLKDGEGDYIWQAANPKDGAPATILQSPYVINQDVAAIGTGAKSVAFGDFNKYVVRMVKEFAIRRLVERYADYDQTGFIGFTRLDGELLDTAAVKRLVHP